MSRSSVCSWWDEIRRFLCWARKVAMRNAFSITHLPRPRAKKYSHLEFIICTIDFLIWVPLCLRLFCYLIGPMKEVVQGLGVTAKTRRGRRLKITLKILANIWCKPTILHQFKKTFDHIKSNTAINNKASLFYCLVSIIYRMFLFLFLLGIRQTHHKTSSRQVPSSSSMSTERKRRRIMWTTFKWLEWRINQGGKTQCYCYHGCRYWLFSVLINL